MRQWLPDISTMEGGSQVNKFEQVSSDGHSMSQVVDGVLCMEGGAGAVGPMSGRGEQGLGLVRAVQWGPMHHG